MRTNDERKIFEASGYLDDGVVSDVLKKYGEKSKITRPPKANKWLKTAVALAACAVLLALAIPMALGLIGDGEITSTSIIEHTAAIPAADNTTEEVETAPVYDGSRGLIYEVNEDGKTASLVSFHLCEDEVMVVASHYNGLPVTVMKNQPYYDLTYVPVDHGYDNKRVKRIVISDTVEEIRHSVLEEMPNLESIYIGASVRKIFLSFDSRFNFKLSSIEVSPENKTFTAKNNCLIEIETKTLVKGCLTSVIPDDGSVEIIGRDAFSLFPIETMVIPEGIKEIGYTAFDGCCNLKSIVLPRSLEVMSTGAFQHCDGLEYFDLNGFTYLPERAFRHADNLAEIKGTENLTSIGSYALTSCRMLNSIDLGTGLEKIGQNAFAYEGNTSIVLNYAGTKAQWDAIEKHEDWNLRSFSLTVRCADQ
jgi:hypothetical protein